MFPFGGGRREAGPLVIDRSDGFCDLELTIVERSHRGGTSHFRVEAIHAGDRLGIAVEVEPLDGDGQVIGGELLMLPARVVMRSLGAESDAFVRMLCHEYSIDSGERPTMVEVLQLTALSLGGVPRRMDSEPVRLKLFREAEDESYFEWYLNTDARTGTLQLREKDADYRGPIARGLMAAH